MMNTYILGLFYRVILVFFCLARLSGATAADIRWKASHCSCAPNADIPMIGYYDASLPGAPENESADDQEGKVDFLNFSLLTRLTYVCNSLGPDGSLLPYWKSKRLKDRIALAENFNTKVDLGLKLSPQFDAFAMPGKNILENLAGEISDHILAFKNDLKTELYRERVKYVSKIITSKFAGDLAAIKDEMSQMKAAFIETDQVKVNFDLLNQKLNEAIGLVLKVKELNEIAKTEKTKEQLKEEIFEELKLKKKEERSLFGKILDYIFFFVPENYEDLEKQSALAADQETIEKKGEIIKTFINEYLNDYEKLVSMPYWQDTCQDPAPEIEEKVFEEKIEPPKVLVDSLAVLEAGLRDCSSEFCRKELAKLKILVQRRMSVAGIPDDVSKTVMEKIKIYTPEETITAPEMILKEMKEALKIHKPTLKDWVWKTDPKFEITSIARDLWGFVREMGFSGLTLDLSELKPQGNQDFFNIFFKAVQETRVDNEFKINLIINSRIFDPESTPEEKNSLAATLRTHAAFLENIIVKFPEGPSSDPTALQLTISRYIKWVGATDKLLLYLKENDLSLLNFKHRWLNSPDGAKTAQLKPDEARERLLRKDTQGLCLDQDVFISNEESTPPDPFLSKYIFFNTDDMLFARQLLYKVKTKTNLDICKFFCPYKKLLKWGIGFLVAVWLLIWLLSVCVCDLKASLSAHFIVFWGLGLLFLGVWLLVLLCDPFMKEGRPVFFYAIAGFICMNIILRIGRILVMAKR